MAVTYKGFGGKETTARGIILDAISVADKAFLAINKNSDDYKLALANWFGALSVDDAAKLKSGVNAMQRQFKIPSFEVEYSTTCAMGENARAQHFTQAAGGVAAAVAYARSTAKLKLTLCERIFASGYKRSSLTEQSQVQVVLHEMSHIGAGTIDVPDTRAGAAADAKLYGSAGAAYAKTSGTAINNAENWGFFLMAFYKLISPH